MTKILIADDHLIIRQGLRLILETENDFELVGEASDGNEALSLCKKLKPDVVLMDLRMPNMDGLTAIEKLRKEQPEIAVVILTTFNEDELMFRGLRAGARGYLLKDTDRNTLFNTIRAAARGETLLKPEIMTRLLAVVNSAQGVDAPLVVMDTAPAAVLGATFDPRVGSRQRVMIVNVGNFHTLAFRLRLGEIEGVFEHHTGLIELPRLEILLNSLASGELKHGDVFDDHGHGALIYDPQPLPLNGGEFGVAVTGPRRNLMRGSSLRPYFAVPFGDMMIAGCFGLLAAVADVMPELSGPIRASFRGAGGSGTPPWEVE